MLALDLPVGQFAAQPFQTATVLTLFSHSINSSCALGRFVTRAVRHSIGSSCTRAVRHSGGSSLDRFVMLSGGSSLGRFVMHSGPLATDELVTVSHGMTSRARPLYSRTTLDCAPCFSTVNMTLAFFAAWSQARGVPPQCPPTRGAFPPTDTAPLSYLVSVASVSMNRATSSRATEPPTCHQRQSRRHQWPS